MYLRRINLNFFLILVLQPVCKSPGWECLLLSIPFELEPQRAPTLGLKAIYTSSVICVRFTVRRSLPVCPLRADILTAGEGGQAILQRSARCRARPIT